MSINLDQTVAALFDSETKAAYAQLTSLKDTVKRKTGVKAKTFDFYKDGRGMATLHVPQADFTPMNISHEKFTATLADWQAGDYSDIFMQDAVSYDERQSLATAIANGIRYRTDQIVIDAILAASTSLTVGQDVGGDDTGLNVAKIARAARLLDDSGVPDTDRFFVASTYAKEQLLGSVGANDVDFTAIAALIKGELKSFYGFSFIWIGTRTEGGLPVTTNVRTNLAYHKSAVGLAEGMEKPVEIAWIPEKSSFMVKQDFRAGGKAIDGEGIVEISTYEAST